MAASPIVTRGYGPGATIALVVTGGYGGVTVTDDVASAVPPEAVFTLDDLPYTEKFIWRGPKKKRKAYQHIASGGGVRLARNLSAAVEYRRQETEDEEALLALMGIL